MARPILPEPPHGSRKRYQLRRDPCRCRACTDANTAAAARYKARKRGGVQLEIPSDAYEMIGPLSR